MPKYVDALPNIRPSGRSLDAILDLLSSQRCAIVVTQDQSSFQVTIFAESCRQSNGQRNVAELTTFG